MVPEVRDVDAPPVADCNPKRAHGTRQSAFGVGSGVKKNSGYEARMSEAAPANRFSDYLLGGLVWLYMRINTSTIRWRIEGLEHIEPLLADNRAFVVAIWHSRLLLYPVLETRVVKRWPNRTHPTTIIVSNSKHGNITNRASELLGLNIIRGSTARKDRRKDKGGVAGARAALKALKSHAMVCMTIDGPRGPAEYVPVEPVKLAQQAGVPVITLGLSSRGARLNTWDRLLMPLPFSSGTMVFGEPITTDKSMDSENLRERIEHGLSSVTNRADALSGREDARRTEAVSSQMETGRE